MKRLVFFATQCLFTFYTNLTLFYNILSCGNQLNIFFTSRLNYLQGCHSFMLLRLLRLVCNLKKNLGQLRLVGFFFAKLWLIFISNLMALILFYNYVLFLDYLNSTFSFCLFYGISAKLLKTNSTLQLPLLNY